MTELEIHRVGYGHPDAVRLIDEVQAEYVVRYGGPDETPLDPLMFEPPAGSFFVGYVDGDPVATGAWRRTSLVALGSGATAEVKRMYVATSARGR
ncbi:GNAT family N-acetyltransferase, partial [Nocardioides hankookensis]